MVCICSLKKKAEIINSSPKGVSGIRALFRRQGSAQEQIVSAGAFSHEERTSDTGVGDIFEVEAVLMHVGCFLS